MQPVEFLQQQYTHFGNFVLGTPFRTAGSLGIRMLLVEACPWIHNSNRARSQCSQENPWTTAPCRTTAPPGTSLWLIETSRCSPSSAGPHATAWAESLEGVTSGHHSWACRSRLLLAEIPEGVDRNSELRRRLQLWESGQINAQIGLVLGQQNLRPLRRTAGKTEPQTDEQRGRRSMCLDSPRP